MTRRLLRTLSVSLARREFPCARGHQATTSRHFSGLQCARKTKGRSYGKRFVLSLPRRRPALRPWQMCDLHSCDNRRMWLLLRTISVSVYMLLMFVAPCILSTPFTAILAYTSKYTTKGDPSSFGAFHERPKVQFLTRKGSRQNPRPTSSRGYTFHAVQLFDRTYKRLEGGLAADSSEEFNVNNRLQGTSLACLPQFRRKLSRPFRALTAFNRLDPWVRLRVILLRFGGRGPKVVVRVYVLSFT